MSNRAKPDTRLGCSGWPGRVGSSKEEHGRRASAQSTTTPAGQAFLLAAVEVGQCASDLHD
jgi:hypothetical protein